MTPNRVVLVQQGDWLHAYWQDADGLPVSTAHRSFYSLAQRHPQAAKVLPPYPLKPFCVSALVNLAGYCGLGCHCQQHVTNCKRTRAPQRRYGLNDSE